VSTVQAVSLYGIYAAYRDAKLYNGNAPITMPKDDFKQLSTAPLQWSVIKKPEVWGACLGALAVGVTTAYLAYPEEVTARVKTTYIEPLSALPIAIGEESLFRGYLQTSLTEVLPPWGAITLSSLAFGAAHIGNAQSMEPSDRWRYYTFSLPIITGLGGYMGWLTYKNRSLKESVALHAWYDFALMCAGAIANTAVIGGRTQVAHSWEF
jgi:membrane protease YdiL (CAAX protease family)